MVIVRFEPFFEKAIRKIKDAELKTRIKKQITKIISTPTIGKPMRYNRKGTREVYIPPFRLSYMYFEEEGRILFLDLYHKDEQ
ncbi:MAG: type II toxin-antitoxin system RelE/ParE family toxin [Nanoarchaeota archaeon]